MGKRTYDEMTSDAHTTLDFGRYVFSGSGGWYEDRSGLRAQDEYVFSLEGEFQGRKVTVNEINVLEDSPIAEVMKAALNLQEGDELVAISVRKPDGRIEVRPWDDL